MNPPQLGFEKIFKTCGAEADESSWIGNRVGESLVAGHPDGESGRRLPVSAAGMQIIIINAAAANSMNVFPASGEQTNALGANTAFAVAANKTAQFYCVPRRAWHSILTA